VTARPNRLLVALALLTVGAGASGCVSLLPKSDPAQLYTFGRVSTAAVEAAPAAETPSGERIGVLLAAVTFPRAAQGDTILAMTGAQAAYIGESRWVAPAVVLFREALERRFDMDAQRTRLIARGDLGRTAMILRLDVREFEAVYPYPEATPTVAVSLRARLAAADGSPLQDRSFEVRRPATENRVGPIVDGLDQAASDVLGQVVAWVDATAAAAPASATATSPAALTSRTPAAAPRPAP